MEKVRSNYDVLMAALGRKCEQYVELQMQMQRQNEMKQVITLCVSQAASCSL